MRSLIDHLIARAQRTPYTHLLHTDGRPYMRRYWLVPPLEQNAASTTSGHEGPVSLWRRPIAWILQRLGITVRLHNICTHDMDPAMHDHPWHFVSVVLRGWYLEARPTSINPCFEAFPFSDNIEDALAVYRTAGDIAHRRPTDRHQITAVSADCWTLIVMGRPVHWWGFYTPAGKIHWRDYPSEHQTTAVPERRAA